MANDVIIPLVRVCLLTAESDAIARIARTTIPALERCPLIGKTSRLLLSKASDESVGLDGRCQNVEGGTCRRCVVGSDIDRLVGRWRERIGGDRIQRWRITAVSYANRCIAHTLR